MPGALNFIFSLLEFEAFVNKNEIFQNSEFISQVKDKID